MATATTRSTTTARGAKAAATKRAPAKPTAAKAPAPRKATKAAAKAAGAAEASTSVAQRIERRIAELGDWRGERLAQIRKLIHEADPLVVEEWKWRGTPVWSHQGMYVLADAFKDKVKITFLHGAQLADTHRLFNNGLGGGKWRAIDLREHDRLEPAAFKALLREAIAYNTTHAVPKSRGSRA